MPGDRPVKIAIRGVRKAFREAGKAPLEALAGADLEVFERELVCLLGPSGCGKSTLLNICAGFEPADEGSVTIDGEPVRGPDPRRVFVFQEYAIFPWLTVRENVAFGLGGARGAEQAAVVQHYVDLVGLQGFERAYPHELSGGMKQRVGVARALAVKPDILYMDEPFGALDSLTRLRMRAELVRIWQAERQTVLFVTHDVDEAVQLGDRVAVMSDRPARVAEVVPVDLAHPRDIGSPEYARVKNRLYELLGVPHVV